MSDPLHRRGLVSDRPALPADLAAAVALGGEMGRQFSEFDWAAHPLGGPQSWPTEVRSAVALALTSRFPTVLWLGTDDLFQIYNDAYSQILGDKHLDALGQRAAHTWWDIWPVISPMLASVIATGEATWSHDLMFPIVTGGRRLERYFTFTYSPLISDRGKTYGVFSSSYETTERVLSERRMQLLNAVASHVLDTNTVDDAAGAVVEVCEAQPADVPFVAAYVGAGAGPTLRAATTSVAALLPAVLDTLTDWQPATRSRADVHIIDDLPARIPGLADTFGATCPDQALLLPLGEDHTTGALLVATSPRCQTDEHYIGFCRLLADQLSAAMSAALTYDQQRQRADALAELDAAKTAFLTNVSHEFRTPLTLLLGPLDHALSSDNLGDELADQLATARRNAGRLRRLVDSLLDFSRIEAGRAAATLVCTDIGALTAHVAASVSELCQRAGLDLELDCRPALADIDPGMWETILLNLLSNAVKYTLTGSIKVAVHSDVALCHITIRDTGVGISDADLKRLGERFFRADSAHGRSVEGTGIGLSLVHGLVELQHGTIEYASEIARGTTVTIRLPRSLSAKPVTHSPARLLDNPYVVEADQWVAGQSAASSSGDAPRHDELVLIADDNADMRAHLERVLSPHWRTVLVSDGQECLDTARKLRPDIIVTDVMMPRLDGFAVIAALRADPVLAATPVVMLSARAGAEAMSEGFSGGADDYLPKPFNAQDLVDRVAARLAAAARATRPSADAQMLRALDVAQLEAALQSVESAAALAEALQGCSFSRDDAPLICVGVLDDEHRTVRFEFGGHVPTEIRDRFHVASMNTPIVPIDVIKTGQPMIITDTRDLDPRYEHVVGEYSDIVRATISQPLRGAGGQVIGSLGMLWPRPRPREFGPDEIDWATGIAVITARALDRIRHAQREHRIAVDFQDHLLDIDHSSTTAVAAAVYQPSSEAMHVGGDWYLVAPSEKEGQIAISVGDAVGHGLPAAVAMSRLRTAAAAIALTHTDPGAVLATLDRYAATIPGARFATVSYAVIETKADGAARVSYSCAGHPWPLLLTPHEPPEFLKDGRRPPVNAWNTPVAHNTAVHLIPPGCVIVLYTDGLIERYGETLDEGFARLQRVAASRADLPVGQLCDELLEQMTPPGGYTDDVVVLALRTCHSTDSSFATVIPASLSHIAQARHLLQEWLSDVGVSPRRQTDILLATGEAVTNAIEHGCGADSSKTVSIEAFVRDGTLLATISDPGQWSGDSSVSQRGHYRGRGLTMINGMADHVHTHRGPAGTRVTLTFDHATTANPASAEG